MTTVQDELKLSSDDLIGASYPRPLCYRGRSVSKLVENRSHSWQNVWPPALQHQGTEDEEMKRKAMSSALFCLLSLREMELQRSPKTV